ncbi:MULTISPECIES: diguanylate cyclase [Ensifer]|uniref:diguanylate cyclase domain-containing protein n=1 Tax=Ensifer TaxID=106591 RepID=UPI0007610D5A|nr:MULTISPECIES: diguanylate cyclase [Ensifer]MBD9543606.1 diguanylate cyclase [Ensifer sp. ENS04]MDF8354534.1 diguanylate cyclase [Ensifer adhaerens]QHG69932.1 diguanylate cyclase [Ensifer adhaerens]THA69006.1 diguanylate cyclase [Ensifer adhaerens]
MVEKALRQAKRDKTVWAIHAACTLVAVLIIASLIYVLDRSVTEADRFGLSAERRLVANELRHQMDAVVQFQAQVSFWDKTYEELATGHVSDSFVADELSGWLWEDYGFSWIIFTDPARTVSTALKDGASVPAEVARVPLDEVDDLVDEAKRRYDNALRNNDGTYNLDVTTPDAQSVMPAVPGIHAVDLREIGGRMSVAVVQAVIPETLVVPAGRRDPVLMVAVRPVTPKMTREIAARLGIRGLAFVPLNERPAGSAYASVGRCSDSSCLVAAWVPKSPGGFVRAELLPSVIIMAIVAALLMAFVALRFSTLFAALQQSEALNRHLAKHDRLTGLMNRSGFDDMLAAALLRASTHPFTLVYADLDEFKEVNDRHGHAAGDAVLVAMAERFRNRAGPKGTVARLGGDEFAVILGDCSEADARSLTAGLIADAQTPVAFDGQMLVVGGSAGIAFAPRHGLTARQLLLAADEALYLAKRRGRNRFETADDMVLPAEKNDGQSAA